MNIKIKNKNRYLNKLVFRLNICFFILLLVTIYEFVYWFGSGSGLSFVLLILSGAVTFFAYTLKKLFEDMRE